MPGNGVDGSIVKNVEPAERHPNESADLLRTHSIVDICARVEKRGCIRARIISRGWDYFAQTPLENELNRAVIKMGDAAAG